MNLRSYTLAAFGLVFGGVLLGQAARNSSLASEYRARTEERAQQEQPGAPKQVDVRAEKLYFDRELNLSLGIDENAKILVGDVAFHHNGAVIACDSAVQYTNSHIDCFRNVIINKDSTFVYGDRAEYNGELNLARVYSPIIKVIDGGATLYTYNFSFNTLDNIGTWFGGGVLYQDDNTMESEKGYFYSDLHELVAVRDVQMRNDTHEVLSDSVRYNTETKIAHFFSRTLIWTREGEIIRAQRGRYNSSDSTYFFHDNAYLLTDFRETWADSIDFNGRTEDALLTGNVQIDDNENDSSAFGDWAQYWGTRSASRQKGETMLTRRPSLLNYNADEGNGDTLYLRADTIFMFVRYPSDGRRRDSLAAVFDAPPTGEELPDGIADSLQASLPTSLSDSLSRPTPAAPPVDTLPATPAFDSLPSPAAVPSPPDSLSAKELKAWYKAENQRAKQERRAAKRAAKEAKQAIKDAKRAAKDMAYDARVAERARRVAAKRGWVTETVYGDSLALVRDSIARMDSILREDSLLRAGLLDSLGRIPQPEKAASQSDTTIRIFRGWHNVKIWRSDMQGVADSMVGFSADSTIHLYQDPILWQSDSQVVADSMTLFTSGGALERAQFYGNPIMGSVLGDIALRRFNQVKSRSMTAWFANGSLRRHDAEGNAQSLYYMTEDDRPTEPIAFMVLAAANMSFVFSNDSLRYITPRETVTWTVYPMDQIPPSQSTRLQGFEWHGNRQPTLPDVFTRSIRPSERAAHEALPRPEFPIAARIDRRREYLISNLMWGDRTDPLPAYAIEFRRQSERRP